MIQINKLRTSLGLAALAGAVLFSSSSAAAPLNLFPFAPQPAPQVQAYAPVETEEATEMPAKFRRQVVDNCACFVDIVDHNNSAVPGQ